MVPSDLICHCSQETAASLKAQPYLTCELFIKAKVAGHGLTYLMVKSEKDFGEGKTDASSIVSKSQDKFI